MAGPTKIVSFGNKHHREMPFAPVIDLRIKRLYNPYPLLAWLTGRDERVQKMMRDKTPDFEYIVAEIIAEAKSYDCPVYLMCTGGRHRSVYLAELVAKHFNVPVEHLDINKP